MPSLKRYISLGIFGLSLLCFNLSAKTIMVCAGCNYAKIGTAVDAADPFDTVLVAKGEYLEHGIKITKPLCLIGENYPKVNGEFKGEIITIFADSVTVDGLFLVNVGTSYTVDYAALRLVRCKYFDIKNLVLERLFFGIYLEKANHGRIFHNKIIGNAKDEYNSGNGIHLWYSHNIVVERNIIQKVRDGIYLEFSDSVSIRNNHSRENLRYGLHFMFSNNDSYTNNIFDNNGAGVAVMFSKFIVMTNNVFKNNWGSTSYGLLLKEIYDAEISNNRFIKNTTGINIEGSNRINYTGNHFESNGWAIKVLGACYANVFTQNNFINNSFDLSYNSKLNDNRFEGNYWSSYSGYDLDRDGIGDVPYRPVKLFSYIANRTPESIVLLRSLFMDIIDFSEKVSPVFTPDNLVDPYPRMKAIK